jgi:type I restriction enzyme S subunit
MSQDLFLIPDNWSWSTLGDVASVKGGYAFKSKDYLDEGVPLIRISNIKNDSIDFDKNLVYLDPKFTESQPDFLLNKGDILIALSGATTGKYGKFDSDKIALLNQRVGRISYYLNEMPDNFLFYYMGVIKQSILDKAYGAAQPNISPTSLSQFDIPIPPLNEQKRIVNKIEELFTKLDAGIQELTLAKEKLKVYRQSVLKHAFEGKLTEEWREDHKDEITPVPDFLEKIINERKRSSGKKYKKPKPLETSDLFELPNNWQWSSIEYLVDVGTGATPLRSNKSYYESGNIPWVTSGALNDLFVSEASEMITELAIKETNAKLFPKNTLLIAMYGEGKTRGKVSELLIDAATNQACAALIFGKTSSLLRPYIKLFFQDNYLKIRRLSSGGVQPNLNLGIIKKTKIPLPPIEEQEEMLKIIDTQFSIFKDIEKNIEDNLLKSQKLRQSILKKAFSGQLVPQDPNDEPAEKLLKRIKAQNEKQKLQRKSRQKRLVK